MKNSKLYNLYNLLTSKEKKKFSRWLEADLNGAKPELLLLREYLDQDAEREEIWEGLFPGQEYNDIKFRTQMKLLHEYIEEYMLFIYVREQKDYKGVIFVSAISERNPSPEYFKKALNKAKKKLDSHKIRDDHYYYYRYILDLTENQFAYQRGEKSQFQKALEVNDSFDSYFIMSKLKLAVMNHSYLRNNFQISTRFLDSISREMENESDFANQQPIQMFFLAYKLIDKGNAEDATRLQKYMKDYKTLITASTYKVMYSILLNFYIRLVNKNAGTGSQSFQAISDLYVDGIEKGILTTNGFLPAQHVNNLVKIGIMEGEFEKARKYLTLFTQNVQLPMQEDVMTLNKAFIFFAERKFREASNLILQKGSGFRADNMEIQARYLALKCNYELGLQIEISEVDNIIRALKRRTQIAKQNKKNYRKMLKYFKKLLRAFSVEDHQLLLKEIKEAGSLADKKWMVEKIESKISG